LYSVGEPTYQTIKRGLRLGLCISGRPVVELDIRASFITIYYACNRQPINLQLDPYDVPGLPRDIVKAWIVSVFGAGKLPKRWSRKLSEDYAEGGTKLSQAYPIKAVQVAVLEKHPLLKSIADRHLNSLDLMFIESEAIVATILRLMKEQGVPSLSVHDSLIVRREDAELARAYLEEEYESKVGAKPFITQKGDIEAEAHHS
jgi:hypothetical protein